MATGTIRNAPLRVSLPVSVWTDFSRSLTWTGEAGFAGWGWTGHPESWEEQKTQEENQRESTHSSSGLGSSLLSPLGVPRPEPCRWESQRKSGWKGPGGQAAEVSLGEGIPVHFSSQQQGLRKGPWLPELFSRGLRYLWTKASSVPPKPPPFPGPGPLAADLRGAAPPTESAARTLSPVVPRAAAQLDMAAEHLVM